MIDLESAVGAALITFELGCYVHCFSISGYKCVRRSERERFMGKAVSKSPAYVVRSRECNRYGWMCKAILGL